MTKIKRFNNEDLSVNSILQHDNAEYWTPEINHTPLVLTDNHIMEAVALQGGNYYSPLPITVAVLRFSKQYHSAFHWGIKKEVTLKTNDLPSFSTLKFEVIRDNEVNEHLKLVTPITNIEIKYMHLLQQYCRYSLGFDLTFHDELFKTKFLG